MNEWFGIVVLLLLSIGISLFSQLHPGRRRKRVLPERLGQWLSSEEQDGKRSETRVLLQRGSWPRRSQLIEQVRTRDCATGKVVGTPTQRVLERFWGE